MLIVDRCRREDNHAMNKDTNLFPWILGGLSISAAAVAIVLVSRARPPDLPPVASAPPSVAAAAPAADLSPSPQAPALAPTPTPTLTPVALQVAALGPAPPAQTTAESSAPGGQIWECMTNGLKTFSNNPCGDKSSLVEVRAINTMNATPPLRYPRTYAAEPAYSQPSDQNSYADQDSYADQEPGYAGNSYAIVPGFAFVPRKRMEHPHRPPPSHHYSGPPPRRN
jgi:hypothetical protein